jgi:membrane-associated phospholipid phosphatase
MRESLGSSRVFVTRYLALMLAVAIPSAANGEIRTPGLFAPTGLVGTVPLAPTPGEDVDALQLPQKTEEHPAPSTTGFRALLKTTAADFAMFPRRPSTWVILGIGAAGALMAHPADDDANGRIASSTGVARFFAPGKWVGSMWMQAGGAVGLYFGGRYLTPDASGQPGINKITHIGFDLLRAQVVSQTFVHSIKRAVRRDRPTGECCAFPSGHAATAFAVASVLERHLGYRAAWPTLLLATYVGVSRLHDNRHFVSDVVFGSAIGMATGWTIVGRHGRNEYALAPAPVRGGVALMVTRRLVSETAR